jgi:voltage-gated potassium channel Kch
MTIRKQSAKTRTPAVGVADRMADAVAYLSRVADDAGLGDISADLRTIRRRLVCKAKLSRVVHRQKPHFERPSRRTT